MRFFDYVNFFIKDDISIKGYNVCEFLNKFFEIFYLMFKFLYIEIYVLDYRYVCFVIFFFFNFLEFFD